MNEDDKTKQPVVRLGVKLIIGGKKGGSLFYNADMFNSIMVMDKNYITMSQTLTNYIDLIFNIKNDRLLSLVGALEIEEALDLLLDAYMPSYKTIYKNKELTFSMKIELLKSLRLIPRHIINAIDLIRRIRNEFSHNLKISKFESLDTTKFINKLNERFRELYPEEDISKMTIYEKFGPIVQSLITALLMYKIYCRMARDYIYSGEFIAEVDRRINEKSKV